MRGCVGLGQGYDLSVPELARFYGIVVRMYWADHPPAHMHVFHGDAQALLRIDTLEIMGGTLSRRALMLVVEWAMAHRAELAENWARAERGEPILPIAPLE